jgi:phosphohistidine phosphatase
MQLRCAAINLRHGSGGQGTFAVNLYFMRHGIAVDRVEISAKSDDQGRTLTAKGIKRMQKGAKGLITLSLSFDRILTSPFERARQTAKIVAQALQLEDRIEEIQQLCPDQSVQDLLRALVSYSGEKRILLVGHEPLLSRTVSFLLSGTAGAEIRLKKGALCCLEVDGLPPKENGILHWALAPKHLRQMAR